MDDEQGLREQFGLELCEFCGESLDSGCDDECRCDGCNEARTEAHEDGMRDTYD